ncbi:O-acetyl-ADP-ribose deacetylase [uncultured Roseburia sp.]|uniref:Macro domain-containing protein n=1 Tax=Brotonthovivens ammoniilytica TaxID=2981725 RepID=A0ABT2TKK8_9FIRM|nr:macro domain-containing protein [Brotonthovivens ammoniilytica]MCU6762745.1 macro domain-containing protein [Brotonthovivens ammoniilytica]SCI86936.1 O-acetyl-ADP-ribose deacetylase [uncultured Roseburia sp.]
MPFLMIRNDITKVQADAIVNPANEGLLEGSGTSRAVFLAAGEKKLIQACARIGHCDVGRAVLTEAFALPARYIIHAVGPCWQGGGRQEAEYLYSAYMESLKLALEKGLKSIAFPLLSAGSYGYPKEEAFKVAASAISDFLWEHDMLVYLVLYDRKSLAVSQKLSASVKEYIDDHYVETKNEEFEGGNQARRFRGTSSAQMSTCFPGSAAAKEIPIKTGEKVFLKKKKRIFGRSLNNLMEHMEESFSQMLLRLIDERGMKDSEVYKKANIDRRHFSKIRKDIYYAPNKKTVMAFAIALELSLDESKDLLMRAGYAFSGASKSDVIISYFIEHERYDIYEINEMLFAYEQPLLGG